MCFSSLVRIFADNLCIDKGRTVHGRIITSGVRPDVYSNNHMLSFYIKSDRINDARNLFDRMPDRNLMSWTALISRYSQMGLAEEALNCFRQMIADGFSPNHYTYVGAISACSAICASRTGKEIHARLFRSFEGDLNTYVSNSLVNMYGKCGLITSAQIVFDAILDPSPVSWGSLLSAYCQCGKYTEGMKIFVQSRKEGLAVNEFSCASVLSASAALENLKCGIQLHTLVIKYGLGLDQYVMTGLINTYAKSNEMHSAHRAFKEIERPHLAAWTALIGGCAQNGEEKEALNLFRMLHSSCLKPGERTFTSVLGAIIDAMDIEFGKQLHSLTIKLGFGLYIFVGNAYVDFYAKCGLLKESSTSFAEMDKHDVVSWNALISGHARLGHHNEAVELLDHMLLEGFEPNPITYSSFLSICGDLPAVEWGKQTHCCLIKPGFHSDAVVGSALIDMYAKCGRLSDARTVFDNLTLRNLVSWNSILMGYSQHGFGRDALEIYGMMQKEGVKPNDITFLGILTACGHMGLLDEGWQHYNNMMKDHGIAPGTDHIACMVSLFGRRGQTKRAYEFIMNAPVESDKVVWRCLLSACKTCKDSVLGRYAAEKILAIDPEDASAHIALSNLYAEAKMWEETAAIRKSMKAKELKKDTGYSWTELKNSVYSFASGHNMDLQGSNLHDVSKGLAAQLLDEGHIPDAAFSVFQGSP